MKRLPVRRRKRTQGGNTLIEFALMSTVLLLLTVGVSDFARVSGTGLIVANAAEAGLFYGQLSPGHLDTQGMHDAAMASSNNATGLTATASYFCTCTLGGANTDCATRDTVCTGVGQAPELYVQMDVSMPFTMTFAMPGLPASFTVSQTSILPVQ
jgi:Flp pilus assembly protein TadG